MPQCDTPANHQGLNPMPANRAAVDSTEETITPINSIALRSNALPSCSAAAAASSFIAGKEGKAKSLVPRRWANLEDELLKKAVHLHDGKNWKQISKHIPGRNRVQCLHRWKRVLMPGLVKGNWSTEEDVLLRKLVEEKRKKWGPIAMCIKGRTAKQCRERWSSKLSPSIKKEPWSNDEDKIIFESQQQLGNRWAEIATLLPGRTVNSIKIRHKSIARAKARAWSLEEDEKILQLRRELGRGNIWGEMMLQFPGRTKNSLMLRCRMLTAKKMKTLGPGECGAPSSSSPNNSAAESVFMDRDSLLIPVLLDSHVRGDYVGVTPLSASSIYMTRQRSPCREEVPENNFGMYDTFDSDIKGILERAGGLQDMEPLSPLV